jgi:CRISPR/Cas system Type II protein with McrA/HNH and RuvC-like nuclease domain
MKRNSKIERDVETFKTTGGRCYYCGHKLWPAYQSFSDLTIDHIIPLSRGGTDDDDNRVPACRRCNSSKNNGSVENLRHHLAQALFDWPKFSRVQIEWLRDRGFRLDRYDNYRFWFERRKKSAQKSDRHGDRNAR